MSKIIFVKSICSNYISIGEIITCKKCHQRINGDMSSDDGLKAIFKEMVNHFASKHTSSKEHKDVVKLYAWTYGFDR